MPEPVDALLIWSYLLLVVLIPAMGYVFMVLDFRAYLRSLRRALIGVATCFSEVPGWARPDTPPCIVALGLSMPCSEADVMRAYRERVKQLHPDRGGDMREFLRLQSHFEQAVHFLRMQP